MRTIGAVRASVMAFLTLPALGAAAWANGIGQPEPGQIGFQSA